MTDLAPDHYETPRDLARKVLSLTTPDGTGDFTYLSDKDFNQAAWLAPELAQAVLDLTDKVGTALELHKLVHCYNECDRKDCPNEHFEVSGEYWACEGTFEGWACIHCCFNDYEPIECKEHLGDHRGVTEDKACITRAALNGDIND